MQWALTGNALPWDLVMQDSQLEIASYLTDVAYEKNPLLGFKILVYCFLRTRDFDYSEAAFQISLWL